MSPDGEHEGRDAGDGLLCEEACAGDASDVDVVGFAAVAVAGEDSVGCHP